jgi:nucleotide-binding universal stress UspA family protein
MIKRIVLALDGSPESSRALPIAEELAKAVGAAITVVHVREMMLVPEVGGRTRHIDEDEITGVVSQQVADLVNSGIDAELQIVASTYRGGPAHDIVGVAKEVKADLIVAGARGYGMVAGLLVGSVAHRLPYVSSCPVLIVPPGEAASA